MVLTRTLLIALCLAALAAAPAQVRAHDSWLEVTPVLIENGQPVSVQMFLGNHSNQHRSYRLAGKWEPQYTKLVVISPKGEQSEITRELVDLGEDEEKVPPKGVKGFYVAQFTPKEEGLYVAMATEERLLQHGDGPKFRSIKTAKTVFSASPRPSVASAKKVTGFSRPVGSGSGMEIIPLSNPLGLAAGDSITLEVRYKGKPITGKDVSLLRKLEGAASAIDLKTDDLGRVTFTAGSADHYLARIKVDEESEKIEGQYEKSTYEATLTFPVFNRPVRQTGSDR